MNINQILNGINPVKLTSEQATDIFHDNALNTEDQTAQAAGGNAAVTESTNPSGNNQVEDTGSLNNDDAKTGAENTEEKLTESELKGEQNGWKQSSEALQQGILAQYKGKDAPEVTVMKDGNGNVTSVDINDDLRSKVIISINEDESVRVKFKELKEDAKDTVDETIFFKDDDRIKEDENGNKYVLVQKWSANNSKNNDCLSRIIRNTYDLEAMGIKDSYGDEKYLALEKAVMDANPAIYGDENNKGRSRIIDGTRHNSVIHPDDKIILPNPFEITELGLKKPEEETTAEDKEETQPGVPEVTVIRDDSGNIVAVDVNDDIRGDIDEINIDKDGNIDVTFKNGSKVSAATPTTPPSGPTQTEEVKDETDSTPTVNSDIQNAFAYFSDAIADKIDLLNQRATIHKPLSFTFDIPTKGQPGESINGSGSYPTGRTDDYVATYDDQGRLSTITATATNGSQTFVTYTYGENGEFTESLKTSYGNNLQEYTYNGDGTLKSHQEFMSESEKEKGHAWIDVNYSYTVNNNGEPVQVRTSPDGVYYITAKADGTYVHQSAEEYKAEQAGAPAENETETSLPFEERISDLYKKYYDTTNEQEKEKIRKEINDAVSAEKNGASDNEIKQLDTVVAKAKEAAKNAKIEQLKNDIAKAEEAYGKSTDSREKTGIRESISRLYGQLSAINEEDKEEPEVSENTSVQLDDYLTGLYNEYYNTSDANAKSDILNKINSTVSSAKNGVGDKADAQIEEIAKTAKETAMNAKVDEIISNIVMAEDALAKSEDNREQVGIQGHIGDLYKELRDIKTENNDVTMPETSETVDNKYSMTLPDGNILEIIDGLAYYNGNEINLSLDNIIKIKEGFMHDTSIMSAIAALTEE